MDGWDGKGRAFQPFSEHFYMAQGTTDGILATPNAGLFPTKSNGIEFVEIDWDEHNFQIFASVTPLSIPQSSFDVAFAFGPLDYSNNGPVGSPYCLFTQTAIRACFTRRASTPSADGFYTRRDFLVIQNSELPIAAGSKYLISYKYTNGIWSLKVTSGDATVTKSAETSGPFYVESGRKIMMFGYAEVAQIRLPVKLDLRNTGILVEGALVWGRLQGEL